MKNFTCFGVHYLEWCMSKRFDVGTRYSYTSINSL